MQEKTFKELSSINVNDKVDSRNGFKYLSWTYAWGEFVKVCPNAKYEIKFFDGKPYLFDEKLGYMVFTSVSDGEDTKTMWLPVMDSRNKTMTDHPYKYFAKGNWNKAKGDYDYVEKVVNPATMFDINRTIMRCLVKNIAMFGLGLYIYSGEDVPEDNTEKSERWQGLEK